MMTTALTDALAAFRDEHAIARSKGKLSVVLHVTRVLAERGHPLDADRLVTAGGGQVEGLGVSRVQAILNDHDIPRVLAKEGGRTSRGSMGLMQAYVHFLNDVVAAQPGVEARHIEAWWVEQVRAFFASKPFRLRYDAALTMRAMFADLFESVIARQQEIPGATILGTVMQHLVGAKLSVALPNADIEHHGVSVADAPTARAGDFLVGDAAIHVTTFPQRPLLDKCRLNLDAGLRPIIVIRRRVVSAAEDLAESMGLADRIEIFEVEQFLSANLHEHSAFDTAGHKAALGSLVDAYNRLVETHETDPSLRIALA